MGPKHRQLGGAWPETGLLGTQRNCRVAERRDSAATPTHEGSCVGELPERVWLRENYYYRGREGRSNGRRDGRGDGEKGGSGVPFGR